MTDTVLARLAALETMPMPELKAEWRRLLERNHRPTIANSSTGRLAYRIQELAYGGLRPRPWNGSRRWPSSWMTRTRNVAHAQPCQPAARRHAPYPGVAGDRHRVTVRDDGYEYEGRPYKSLSSVARAITGTRWNGWVFFGLKNRRSREALPVTEAGRPQAPLRGLHPQVHARRGWSRSSTASMPSARPARPMSPARSPKAGCWCPTATMTAASRAARWSARHCKRLLADIEAGRVDVVVVYKIDRLSRSLMDFAKLVEVFDRQRRHLRQRHPVVQHHHLHGPADAQHPALLRPVRARGHRRAHPRQVRRLAQEGHLDGRLGAARLRRQEPQAGHQRGRGRRRPRHLPRFVECGSPRPIVRDLEAEEFANKYGRRIDKGQLLQAPEQPGLPRRGGPQGHRLSRRAQAIIDRALWDKVHAILSFAPQTRPTSAATPALLRGLIFGPNGRAMSPTHTRKRGDSTGTTSARRSLEAPKHARSAAFPPPTSRGPSSINSGFCAPRDRRWPPGGRPATTRRFTEAEVREALDRSTLSGTNSSRPSKPALSGSWSSGSTCIPTAGRSSSRRRPRQLNAELLTVVGSQAA